MASWGTAGLTDLSLVLMLNPSSLQQCSILPHYLTWVAVTCNYVERWQHKPHPQTTWKSSLAYRLSRNWNREFLTGTHCYLTEGLPKKRKLATPRVNAGIRHAIWKPNCLYHKSKKQSCSQTSRYACQLGGFPTQKYKDLLWTVSQLMENESFLSNKIVNHFLRCMHSCFNTSFFQSMLDQTITGRLSGSSWMLKSVHVHSTAHNFATKFV